MIQKTAIALVFVVLATLSTTANAWFFFFIPGLFSSSGNRCVKETAKVDDVVRSPSGNTMTIKSINGASSRCSNASIPILATVEFSYTYRPHVVIDIPEGYEQKDLNDDQRFSGGVLNALNHKKETQIYVRSQKREVTPDPSQFARGIGQGIMTVTTEGKTSNEEQLVINNMRAWRFELTAKSTGIFGRRFTYLITVLEGDDEVVGITASAPAGYYLEEKAAFRHLAETVTGIKTAPATANAAPPAPIPAPINSLTAAPPQEPVPSTPKATPAAVETPSANASADRPPISSTSSSSGGAGAIQSNTEAAANRLRELNKLFKEGILSQQEYDAKKQEILKGM